MWYVLVQMEMHPGAEYGIDLYERQFSTPEAAHRHIRAIVPHFSRDLRLRWYVVGPTGSTEAEGVCPSVARTR